MAIYQIGKNLVLGVALPLVRFPALAEEHQRRFVDTEAIEWRGAQLRQMNFLEAELQPFITAVCNWGGYPGIGGRILNHNPLPALRDGLREADELLDQLTPDVQGALARLNRLHSLGSTSFASKHLRFLRPNTCPVFDSVLRDALPYSFDPEGYAAFAKDCRSIGEILQQQRANNPWGRPDGAWFAADVEAALYVHFNEWA